MTATATTVADTLEAQTPDRKGLEDKWGKSVIAAGYTVLPTVVLKYQQRLGLKPLDINILMLLISYWWQPDNLPRPGKTTMGALVGVDPSTVRRCLKKLEERGYVKRIARRRDNKASQPNAYSLQGLVDALAVYAAEEHQEISRRKANNLKRLAGKKAKPLELVKK